MSKIDLTSPEWCDLIFEGKNKAYGAFRMRKYSPRRHNIAMLVVLAIVLVAFAIPSLIKWVTPKQEREVMTEVTQLSQLETPEVKQKELTTVVAEPVVPPALKSTVKFTAPKIVEDDQVSEDDEIKSQDELLATNTQISIADVVGNDEENGADIADLKNVVIQGTPEPEQKVLDFAEQMPGFPGGEEALRAYLAENVKYPVICQEQGIEGRVIIQFVVGADGSISNVTVARGADPYLDKEAARVVETMPKWIPGRQNGKAVPVKFTVPITFKLSN